MAHLLIVEDEKNIQEHLERKARAVNPKLKITVTGYAEEALEIAKNEEITVFFLDIHLLDYSGRYLADELRAIKKYEFTPIVFITGDVHGEMDAYRHVHFCQYLTKPFRDEQLEEVCRKVLINYVKQQEPELPQIRLDYKGHSQRVYLKDIVYIESRLRSIYIKFVNHKKEYKHKQMSLKKFSEKLNDDFIQIHQAFIVNKDYIRGIDKKKHIMKVYSAGKNLPIGSSFRKYEGTWIDDID